MFYNTLTEPRGIDKNTLLRQRQILINGNILRETEKTLI